MKDQTTYNKASTIFARMFPVVSEAMVNEDARLEEIQHYTLAFWDVHLSPEYNTSFNDDEGSNLLELTPLEHMLRDDIAPSIGFILREAVTQAFFVRNGIGEILAQFQSDGNVLLLKGQFLPNQSSITTSSALKEFIVNSPSGVTVAKIRSDTGDLYLKGTSTPNAGSVSITTQKELVIRNAEDTSGQAQIVIDVNGNMTLRGNVFDP